jgi:hypothetical protein
MRFSLIEAQDAVDLGNQIIFGDGDAKKLDHPGIQVLFVPKHPFMDDGFPLDVAVPGRLHYLGEVTSEVVTDMSR